MKLEDDLVFITESSNEVIIVSELAEQNLEEYVRSKDSNIPEEEILKIFTQIVLGLDFIHYKQLKYRNLKPHNILLFDNSTTLKIVDFGLGNIQNYSSLTDLENTGTYAYMALETSNDFQVPFFDDMYSLGLVLRFMMTKQHPINNSNYLSEIPVEEKFTYSENLISISEWLLKKSPKDRPNTKQLIQRLFQHPLV